MLITERLTLPEMAWDSAQPSESAEKYLPERSRWAAISVFYPFPVLALSNKRYPYRFSYNDYGECTCYSFAWNFICVQMAK